MNDMMSVSTIYSPQSMMQKKNDKKEKTPDIILAYTDQNQVKALKASPKDVLEWVAVADAIGALVAKYGPEILNIFKSPNEQPQEEEKFEMVA